MKASEYLQRYTERYQKMDQEVIDLIYKKLSELSHNFSNSKLTFNDSLIIGHLEERFSVIKNILEKDGWLLEKEIKTDRDQNYRSWTVYTLTIA